jgi:hypothetical protein
MGLLDRILGKPGATNEDAPANKPGRNEPCWCGSGRKYKKCHLPEDTDKAVARSCSTCGPT